jgi:CheY-like chemotaxis protein
LSDRKDFAISLRSLQSSDVTQPLAIVFYEKLMPGSQLVIRLQDLKYRVQPVTDSKQLAAMAKVEGPMLILADLESDHSDICSVIAGLRNTPDTAHIPILAFAEESAQPLQASARQAGATVVVSNTALLAQLPELLEQALRVE